MAVTAPQICPECGAYLDAGEKCDCKAQNCVLCRKPARTYRMLREGFRKEDFEITINYA